jgi:hypothetical protein
MANSIIKKETLLKSNDKQYLKATYFSNFI